MKKILLGLAIALLSIQCMAATNVKATVVKDTATGAYTGINWAWSYTPTPGIPNCSTTITTNCFSGFKLTITPPSGSGGSVTISPITLTQGLTSYLWSPGGNLYVGTWNASLVANGVGATTTTPLVSSATTTTVVVPLNTLNGPTGLSGTPQ